MTTAAFDYTARLETVIHHVVRTCPELKYVNPDRLLISSIQTRAGGTHGVYATIQPLRFKNGAETIERGGRLYRWPKVLHEGKEVFYVVCFRMPRFVDLTYRAKLTTIFHELYHVSPDCNGDIRRFPGKNFAHGHSREAYNARLQPWVDRYVADPNSAEVTAFLHLNFAETQKKYGTVTGRHARTLKPMPDRRPA